MLFTARERTDVACGVAHCKSLDPIVYEFSSKEHVSVLEDTEVEVIHLISTLGHSAIDF